MDFIAEGAALLPELQEIRRTMHREPEIGLDLPKTQRIVLDAISDLGLKITTGERTTSVVGVLRGGKPGPVVLLRGDMDGLPVQEQTGLEYAGENGNMHACGHDLHTAGLIGAAKILAAHRDELPGTVLFMFQPGEEGYGGAKVMIDEGLLEAAGERPVAGYAIHVAPGPRGVFNTRSHAMLAGSNYLTVTVHGKGGHGSQPATALDPVPPMAEMITGLQTMITRAIPTFEPVVMSVTMVNAGTAMNVIPDQAQFMATVRTLSNESRELFVERGRQLVEGIAAAYGCTAEFDFSLLYPVTWNDEGETRFTLQTLSEMFGPERTTVWDDPLMGSEDFSFVAEELPISFYMLAASPDEVDPATAAYNHSPFVLFDDAVLGDQAAALAQMAWKRLEQGSGKLE
ncbi:M20 metallopeptidase family protein [Nigerium massiliense]|uniref:M20 metallopeptidase family protein n=1 Tax=Nigerium massiliense TaxID=1522317 RepID=UPI00058DC4DA|nr:M20 family metallopeptidase [Nigerium massiliense]